MALWLALSIFFGLPARAEQPAAQNKALFTPQGQAILDRTLQDLYGLDYAQADAGFRSLVALEPDNPFSYLVEAASLWWQAANVGDMRHISAAQEAVFKADIAAALDKSDGLLQSSDAEKRADGHFVAGMILGMRGQWEVLKRHWLRAYLDGKKAVKRLNACVRIDPNYDDAYLGLGVYDYQVAHYKKFLGLGFLLGARGNEEQGIGLMRLALEKGRMSSEQAALFLITIYIVDRHDYARAMPLVRNLAGQFPESLYFKTLEIALDYHLGNDAQSLSEAQKAFERIRQDPEGFQRKLLSLACGIAQKECLNGDYAESAAGWFDMAVSSKTASAGQLEPQEWQTFSHLYRGYAEDVLGQRRSAQADYQWVLSHAEFLDAHKRAHACLERRCGAREISSYFKALSAPRL